MSDNDKILAEIKARHEQVDSVINAGYSINVKAEKIHSDRAMLLQLAENSLEKNRRERIATACLAGMLANSNYEGSSATFNGCAYDAVLLADALIARLDKEAKP